MELTPLLSWSLIVLVVILALQSIFLGVAILVVHSRMRRLYARGLENMDRVRSFLNTADTTLNRVSELVSRFPEWGTQVQQAAAGASRAVAEVDAKVEQGLSYVQSGLHRWQGQSDELFNKLSKTSEEVYDAVLAPASRVSLFLRTAGAFLGRLFADAKAGEDPSNYHQDQQIFI